MLQALAPQPDRVAEPATDDELGVRRAARGGTAADARAARVQHAYEHLREAQAASQVEPGTEEAEEQSLRALAETFGDDDEEEER